MRKWQRISLQPDLLRRFLHLLIIIEPILLFATFHPPRRGDDTGPTAVELAVMALADCTATIFAKVAKDSNIEVKDIKVVAEAEKP